MKLKKRIADLRDHAFLPNDPTRPLESRNLHRMKWLLLGGNFMANLFAFVLMETLLFRAGPLPSETAIAKVHTSVTVFHILAACTFVLFAVLYERPFRTHLDNLFHKRKTPAKDLAVARRRLLNEPFVVAGMDLVLWLMAATFTAVQFKLMGEPVPMVTRMFFLSLNTGMITSVMAFFLLEHIAMWHLSPFFFPQGGQAGTPGTLRVRIVVRLMALLLACNVIPLLTFVQLYLFSNPKVPDLAIMVHDLRIAILTNALFFMVVGFSFTLFVHSSFSMPVEQIIRVLNRIRQGDYGERVLVTTNDELGYTGDMINEMCEGLKERERMQQSLLLAREVQQNLLPAHAPVIPGLRISGGSLYCDETGGDYYDYLDIGRPGENRIAIAVGDVSDHGLQAALLMISARACIRHEAVHNPSLEELVTNVNRHICRDTEQSGQFMTLFVAEIDTGRRSITWVRAGHDPGLIYDPDSDGFQELDGSGMALGITPETTFETRSCSLEKGQVIVIGTDGIWEAVNPAGEAFGKERLQDIIRQNGRNGADQIHAAIIDGVMCHTEGVPREDDITVVVATLEPRPAE